MIETITIQINSIENSCFVAMPFSALYQIEYESIIRPTLEELNIECIRGDEIYSKQRIMDDIWESIKSCRLVIAELTGKNPNVLYEVGLAHAIGKPVIILTRNGEDVPFDLKDLRYLYYDVNDPFWGNNLKKGLKGLIEKVIENPEIDKYLEGITPIPKEKYPEIKMLSKAALKKDAEISIFGNWKGSWQANGSSHNITLNIFQNENLLNGVATINYDEEEKMTVVQQIFEGKINNDMIILQGVNYTYIERGDSSDYRLDTFDLKYHNGKLIGEAFDQVDQVKVFRENIILERI